MMMLVECGETPAEWTQRGVELVFEEILPHDYPQACGYERAFTSVVATFLDWLAAERHLVRARALADYVRQYLPHGYEMYGCEVNQSVFRVSNKVMGESGLNGASLADTAIYIATYTETVCGKFEREQEREDGSMMDPTNMMLTLMCPCGSGKRYDECCGRAN